MVSAEMDIITFCCYTLRHYLKQIVGHRLVGS